MFGQTHALPIFAFLLSCMLFLHIMWFMMFVKLLNKFMKTSSTEDEHSKTEVEVVVLDKKKV